jgi:hypothetical protein
VAGRAGRAGVDVRISWTMAAAAIDSPPARWKAIWYEPVELRIAPAV